MCFVKHDSNSFVHTHPGQHIKPHSIDTVHIICIGAVILNDRRLILALSLSFIFLSGFTQVRFNFIDDVISLYEVG